MLIYWLGVLVAGGWWLTLFLLDRKTPKTDATSWVVLAIAALSWPVAMPIACAELLHRLRSSRKSRCLNLS